MDTTSKNQDYFTHAHVAVPHRDWIWEELILFLKIFLNKNYDTVVDLGAGYGHFINLFPAKQKIAVDLNPNLSHFVNPDVQTIIGSAVDLQFLKNDSVDLFFASNLVEHLLWDDIETMIEHIHRALKPGGQLILLQPNFYYCYREYFHDYTHRTIFTHIGLSDYLASKKFKVTSTTPKFVPLSMQAKYGGPKLIPLPTFLLRLLLRIYLRLPFKFMAKQMLLIVEK